MNEELEGKKYYYSCVCGAELIRLEIERDEKWRRELFFAIFDQGLGGIGWGTKLRWIWKIIRTGTPYGDQIILSTEDARRMANDILKETKEE